MAYLIGEVTKELLETVHEFCEKEVRDLCRECDRSGEVPLGLFRQAMELQFHMLDIPECYGGLGLDKISAGALLEEMAKADAGFAVTFAASSLGLKPILFAGSEELKKEACALLEQGGLGAFCLTEPEAGSDAGAIKTRAEKRDGAYLLNGRKCFITNGSIASFYSVAALTENGEGKKEISMFFVRADAEGVKAGGHEDKMGIRTSDTCDVIFENVKLAYEIGKETYKNIRPAMELKNCKYNLGYRIYYNTEQFQGIEDGMSIGIYESALEQTYLSNLLCEGKDVKKVGLHYHETYNAFVHKEIDLVVQRDDCEEYQIYKNKSVSLDYLGLDEQIMTPVILINKEDYGMEELMKNNVNVIEMAAIQKDVMEGKMDPSYY